MPVGDAAADAKDLPPALAAMLEERREKERDAAEAAERDAIVVLPADTWREIASRAASLGITAELLADGSELRLAADSPVDHVPTDDAAEAPVPSSQ